MTNKNLKILFALLILLVFGILVVFIFDIDCVFKSIFHIPCPGCGLTRSFREIFKRHILNSFNYNILGFPLFILIIIIILLLIIDFIKRKDYTYRLLTYFSKHYIIIIILLIISWIINIIRHI